MFSAINEIHFGSKHGFEYISAKYPQPQYRKKFILSLRSCKDPGFITAASNDSIFRIVTCSYLVPVKRIALFVKGLECFSKSNPALTIEWTHIGDGPLREEVQEEARTKLSKNISFNFTGHIVNSEVYGFYQLHPVDLFVNVSFSEGLTTAVMEAQSCGIPVMATAVGGQTEIVNDENGLLLSSNPSPEEIAAGLTAFALNPEMRIQKKLKSREWARTQFKPDKNYSQFVAYAFGERYNGFIGRSLKMSAGAS